MIVKKHKILAYRKTHMTAGFIYIVELPFNSTNPWNELCANVLEVFGLPGKRYVTSVSEGRMEFMFRSEKDKQLCMLLLSEYV